MSYPHPHLEAASLKGDAAAEQMIGKLLGFGVLFIR